MRIGLALLASALLSGTALAQVAPQPPRDTDMAARMAAMRAEEAKRPDTPGTGSHPALKTVEASLPDHVIYRPRDLASLGDRKLGVVLWGNGGCAADGASARFHLLELASHGYLVIAPGKVLSGPGAVARPADAPSRGPDPVTGRLPQIATTWQDVTKGLDWALAENARADSPYRNRIDPAQIAVAGHSCGGLQAIQAGADQRVATVIVHNSGVFTDGTNPIEGMSIDKSMLKALHTPVLYVLGGKGDVAWPNGTDDYARIDHVPAVLIDGDVGHGGTFREANGGDVARFSVAWLNWQLRGDRTAAAMFSGADCGLCADPKWRIERKGL